MKHLCIFALLSATLFGNVTFDEVAADSTLWDHIDTSKTVFDPSVRIGTAISHYQTGGSVIYPDSQWNTSAIPLESSVTPPQSLAELTRGGIDIWDNPDKVINTLHALHMNAFRLSAPEYLWPREDGSIDNKAYAKFRGILERLKEEGISVQLTCHHFSHPKTFESSGGFFSDENCDLFVTFCEHLYDAYGDLVDEWCTINEPTVYATGAYLRGVFPPCERNFEKLGQLLIQLIKTHNKTYVSLCKKAEDAGREIVIGFSHQQITFEAEHWWNPLTQVVSSVMTHIMSDAFLEFYRKGSFTIYVPGLLNMSYHDPEFAENNGYLTSIFLQCYARPLIGTFPIDTTHHRHEWMTNMPYRFDPAALYAAIKKVYAITGKPISVTEFGTATHNERLRSLYFERALYAIYAATQKGIPIRSIYAWTLVAGDKRAYHEWDQDPVLQDFGLTKYTEHGETFEIRDAARVIQRVIDRSHR